MFAIAIVKLNELAIIWRTRIICAKLQLKWEAFSLLAIIMVLVSQIGNKYYNRWLCEYILMKDVCVLVDLTYIHPPCVQINRRVFDRSYR